jgi:hypothetical protein
VLGLGQGSVEIMAGEVRLRGAGQVDGVAARVLVVSPVVGLDSRVEALDGLAVVAEVERG